MAEREVALIELLADLSDRRTKEQKAQACGYSAKHVYRLQRRADFREAVHRRMMESLNINLTAVFQALCDKAVDGDVKSAELLLKASGYIGTGGQTNITSVTTNTEKEGTLPERIRKAIAWRASKT